MGALTSDTGRTNCVCGHPKEDHSSFEMSKPLVNPHPEENDGLGHYPVKTGMFQNNIFVNRHEATYESENCSCGCTIYEADDA